MQFVYLKVVLGGVVLEVRFPSFMKSSFLYVYTQYQWHCRDFGLAPLFPRAHKPMLDEMGVTR